MDGEKEDGGKHELPNDEGLRIERKFNNGESAIGSMCRSSGL